VYIYNIAQLHLLRIQLTTFPAVKIHLHSKGFSSCFAVLITALVTLLSPLRCILTVKIFLCPLPDYY